MKGGPLSEGRFAGGTPHMKRNSKEYRLVWGAHIWPPVCTGKLQKQRGKSWPIKRAEHRCLKLPQLGIDRPGQVHATMRFPESYLSIVDMDLSEPENIRLLTVKLSSEEQKGVSSFKSSRQKKIERRVEISISVDQPRSELQPSQDRKERNMRGAYLLSSRLSPIEL
jgi:hypothetical protein